MVCQRCHGSGMLVMKPASVGTSARLATNVGPCPDCMGSGITHCCDPQTMPDAAAKGGFCAVSVRREDEDLSRS